MTLDRFRDERGFLSKVEEVAERIRSLIDEGGKFLVLCHVDADGLSSGAIASAALLRENARFATRAVGEFDDALRHLADLPASYIPLLVDMGSGYLDEISRLSLNRPIIILDHHEPMGSAPANVIQLNPHLYGINGSEEVSGAGVAYLVAKALNEENIILSPIAVTGALGDMQDRADGRGLHGFNERIVEDAVKAGLLRVEEDLLFYGRSSKPIHVAMASTMNPFIVGISGNEANAYGLLTEIGIRVKEDDRWRVLSELSEDEKKQLYNGILKYLASLGLPPSMARDVIGKVYELTMEEPWTYLRDAREFASLLNACGKTGNEWLGISIAMGSRGALLEEAQRVLEDYRRRLAEAIDYAMRDENRQELKNLLVIDGGGVIDDRLISSVASMLSSMGVQGDKRILVALAQSEDSIKVSARAPRKLVEIGVNLGRLLASVAELVGGRGGGHDIAAGASIPKTRKALFILELDRAVEEELSRVR
ncbi:MAG: DHH family phosphoesterase [Nitrososphaerota archaeon]